MNSFPNFNQISISIKDIAFLCFTNFHCNFVSKPTYITQSVWMLYYIWFIDLYFILFNLYTPPHLEIRFQHFYFDDISKYPHSIAFDFLELFFFLCRNLGGKSEQFAKTIDCWINVPIWNFQDNWTRVINSNNYRIFIQDNTFYSFLTYKEIVSALA